VLGTSEGIGTVSNLFVPEDRSMRIFSKKFTARRAPLVFSMHAERPSLESGFVRASARFPEDHWNYLELQKEFDRRLLAQYSPTTAFVNEDFELVHTRGNLSPYLKLAPGRPSLNVVKMAREGLQIELRNALSRAKKDDTTVRRAFVQVRDDTAEASEGLERSPSHRQGIRLVNFEVSPIRVGNVTDRYFMLLFRESPLQARKTEAGAKAPKESESAARRIAKLEDELAATKEYLQSVIETQEATNEELQSANEEILSSNEELQSTNEEMETAKEELQSANEELTTVNDELRNRNVELTQVNNDLMNLLSSIDIAVIMIGSDLTIRRFTPKAQKFLGLIPADVGRPLSNINPTIEIADLQAMVLRVVSDFRTLETELTDRLGVHYQFKILPYRTMENKIDGAVITIVDIAPDRATAQSNRLP
jgi:two-component system CheB/CheR fusion protein